MALFQVRTCDMIVGTTVSTNATCSVASTSADAPTRRPIFSASTNAAACTVVSASPYASCPVSTTGSDAPAAASMPAPPALPLFCMAYLPLPMLLADSAILSSAFLDKSDLE
jgi:cell division septation protein DedD